MGDVMGLARAADDRRLEELPEQQPSITPTGTRDTSHCGGVSRSSRSQVAFVFLLLSQPFSAHGTQKVDPNTRLADLMNDESEEKLFREGS